MIPDLNFVADTFRRFNLSIFKGSLPLPRFRLTHARTFQGKLAYRWRQAFGLRKEAFDFEMRISTAFDLPDGEWEDVVIHEMIHLHIAANRIEDSSSHGPAFRKLMNEINRTHNRHITISARTSPEQLPAGQRITGHYICIAKFSDGRLAMAPAAKSRIFELWDIARFFPNVVAVKWIGSTDPWFCRFPKMLKPKLYVASEEMLLPHLKGAVLFARQGNVIKAVNRRCSPDELLP